MNKKIIALLGACCLCFASADFDEKQLEKEAKELTLQGFSKRIELFVKRLRRVSIESDPNWVVDLKKNYKNPETLQNGIATAIIEVHTLSFKESKELMQEAKIKEEEVRDYIKNIVYQVIEKL